MILPGFEGRGAKIGAVSLEVGGSIGEGLAVGTFFAATGGFAAAFLGAAFRAGGSSFGVGLGLGFLLKKRDIIETPPMVNLNLPCLLSNVNGFFEIT